MRPLLRCALSPVLMVLLAVSGACLEVSLLGAPCEDLRSACGAGLVCTERDTGEGICLPEVDGVPGCPSVELVERSVLLSLPADIAALLPPDDDRCIRVSGDVQIDGTDLDTLAGLERLVEIGGDLRIVDNSRLTSLDGLDGLRHVEGKVELLENRALGRVSLKRLEEAEELVFSGTSLLSQLGGLTALTQVRGRLYLAGHQALTDLHGLERLERVGALSLEQNPALASLDGLDGLLDIEGALVVRSNPALPACAAEALRDRTSPASSDLTGNDDVGTCP